MSLDFLLEIGTEEIPHWMIPGALAQLAEAGSAGRDAARRCDAATSGGAGDRCSRSARPIAKQIVKGPPVSAGDKAAAGFAKKQGVDPSAHGQGSGDYYELRKTHPGPRDARTFSPNRCPPRSSASSGPRPCTGPAARPARASSVRSAGSSRCWAIEVIPFEIAGVKSGNITRGHRIWDRRRFRSPSRITKPNCARISSSSPRMSAATRSRPKPRRSGAKLDADLLETLTFITEYPTAIRGDFDPAYLELPAEVLTTVMRHHQKYFSVESAPGMLAPHFVAVMNTSGDPEGLVKHGNERVLKARFNDARFFWDVDQQKKLADRVRRSGEGHVPGQARVVSGKDRIAWSSW